MPGRRRCVRSARCSAWRSARCSRDRSSVEYVTTWPGLGRLMYEALRARDIYLVAGCAAAGSAFLACGTLAGDLLLAAVDPRVREERPREGAAGIALLAAGRAGGAAGAVARAESARPSASPSCCTRRRRACTSGTAARGAPFIYRQRVVSRLERRFETMTDRRASRCAGFATAGSVTADAGRRRAAAPARRRRLRPRHLRAARARLAPDPGARARRHARRRSSAALIGGVSRLRRRAAWTMLLSRVTEFVLVLPAIYVVLALRAAMPLVVPPRTVFLLLAAIFVLLGWPTWRAASAPSSRRSARATTCRPREALGAGSARLLCPAPAAGGARAPRHAGHAAAAGVHPRRGDAVLHRPGVSRGHAHLGHDAAGRGERRAARRHAVGAGAGRRDISRGPRGEPRRAGSGLRPRRRAGDAAASLVQLEG